MKKLLTILGVSVIGVAVVIAAGGTGYTGAPSPSVLVVSLTAGVAKIALTNNVEVVNVTLNTTAAAGGSLVRFFDSSSTNDPYYGTNYVNASYVSTASYASNVVTSYVGYNGYTNWYTNTGSYTLYTTNAANTNNLPAKGAAFVPYNAIATLDTPMAFQQGISVLANSNSTAVIYYIPNR